ncbi:PWWP domain-containing protein 2-like isoform X3 [Quercus robur]|uniref:PWWP domain-containing protein 2-like isoform X3 n=1 Tax=Quercus robur TaxID=38942 RepID=UPI00216257AC|nr:PWWP domain-containing protein 2-like isoform X3 [Quercus robur]
MSANSSHIDLNSDVVSADTENGSLRVKNSEPSVKPVGSETETLTVKEEPLKSLSQVQGSLVEKVRIFSEIEGAESLVGGQVVVGEVKSDKELVLESKNSVGTMVGDSGFNEKNVGTVDGDPFVEGNDPLQNRAEEEVVGSDGGQNGKQVNVDEVSGSRQGDREPGVESVSQLSTAAEIDETGVTHVSEVLTSEGLENQDTKMDAVVETNEKRSPDVHVSEVLTSEGLENQNTKMDAVVETNEKRSPDVHVSEVLTSEGLENQDMKMDAVVETDEKRSPDARVSEVLTSEGLENQDMKMDAVVETNEKRSPDTHISEVLTSEGLENQDVKMDAVVETDEKQSPDAHVMEAGVSETIGEESNAFNLVVDLNPYMTTDENVKSGASRPEFHVSDLVWGKVRSHPWWPGQIFDPSDSSDKAKKYFRKDGYLIAYFGDQTFAWNEEARIKSFRGHFSQMEKQSNKEEFHYAVVCALEEISRRVEFGLACSCTSEEVYAKLRTQIIANAGIREESSRRVGGDYSLTADSFEPVELVNYIKELAQSPHGEANRLELVIARAQLSAFYRWKGYSQLPEFNMVGALLESDADILPIGEKKNHSELNENAIPDIDNEKPLASGKGKSKSQLSSSGKRKHISGDSTSPSKKKKKEKSLSPSKKEKKEKSLPPSKKEKKEKSLSPSKKERKEKSLSPSKKERKEKSLSPSKKEKSLSDLLTEKSLRTSNGENGSKKKDVGKLLSKLSGKKRKAVDGTSDDSSVKDEKHHLSSGSADKPVQTRQTFKVGDSIRRAASQLNGSSPILKYGDGISQDTADKNKSKQHPSLGRSHISELTKIEVSSPEEMLSQLCLAARDPMKGYNFLVSIVSFFSGFRNSVSRDDSNFMEREWCLKRVFGGKTGKRSRKRGIIEKSKLETSDSYWTDRIIQSLPEEHSSLENQNEAREILPETPSEKDCSAIEPLVAFEMSLNMDSKQQSFGENLGSDAVKPVAHLEESFRPDPSPTALILNFMDMDAVPSEANLNKIFSRFGSLNDSETEVIKKSNRAKVVFKRRADAETAFSSAGKFSIFGPSLVSYRLKYLSSTPSKASPSTKKRGRKDTTSEEGNAV